AITGTPTFVVGAAGTLAVTATGFPTPTLTAAGLPDGVTFTDHGGTGTLDGTPTAGTGGDHTVTITAANGVGPGADLTFTLVVNESPAITSGGAATFTVGSAGTFTVTTTGF